jgi:hypothetical protein
VEKTKKVRSQPHAHRIPQRRNGAKGGFTAPVKKLGYPNVHAAELFRIFTESASVFVRNGGTTGHKVPLFLSYVAQGQHVRAQGAFFRKLLLV